MERKWWRMVERERWRKRRHVKVEEEEDGRGGMLCWRRQERIKGEKDKWVAR